MYWGLGHEYTFRFYFFLYFLYNLCLLEKIFLHNPNQEELSDIIVNLKTKAAEKKVGGTTARLSSASMKLIINDNHCDCIKGIGNHLLFDFYLYALLDFKDQFDIQK